MYKYLMFLLVYFFCKSVDATHLVGGEMNYKYLGENVYEFSLKVYRDCYLGIPDFDRPAYIAVYDFNGEFQGVYTIFGRPKTLLPVVLDDECYSAPPNVCVERIEYLFNGFLEDNGIGYYVSYQRCCRNSTILNIYDDSTDLVEESGMNLYTFVPSPSKIINSNPVFKEYPPVAICVNKPLVFDHSAIDAEGDSLVYKLCTPTDALTADIPIIFNYFYDQIPFDDVRWRQPYSIENMIGGTEPLQIDSKTGLLTGFPDKVGQFAVGVCIEEYRNHQLIAETKRDFQFNIAQCGKTSIASFFSFDTICNSLSVPFKNESIASTKYFWDFGDGTTSDSVDPTHLYDRYGTYTVTLIASSDIGCADTATKTITLFPDNFEAKASDVSVCLGDSAHLKIETVSSFQYVKWGIDPPVYNQQLAYSYIPSKSDQIVFEIKSSLGCVYIDTIDVRVNSLPNINLQSVPAVVYIPQNVEVSTSIHSNEEYIWILDSGDTLRGGSSIEVFVEKSQWVKLIARNTQTGCIHVDSIFIEKRKCEFDDFYQLNLNISENCEDYDLQHIILKSEPNLDHSWYFENETVLSDTFMLKSAYNQMLSYALILEINGVCMDTIRFENMLEKVFPVLEDKQLFACKEDTLISFRMDLDYNDDYFVLFEGREDTVFHQDIVEFPLSGVSTSIPFQIHYGDSCIKRETIFINISDISVQAQAQPSVVVKGEEVELTASPQNLEYYQWSPNENISQAEEAVTNAIVFEKTDFVVLAKDIHGCIAYDTVSVDVKDDVCEVGSFYIPTAFTPNGDGVNDTWQIRTQQEVDIQVQIFNRWGEKVFESNSLEHSWDGTFKGEKADAGAYAYYLTVTCWDQQTYFFKGNITLIQ